ncbi:MAG: P1 family peptidase [Corynebacterium sp.]|uniref:P1 family peptidase n=1 Tax=Corynebacterium sp. TaxID=1720 RepID=UPI0026DD308E|nr:P1 family peptidase [Corynebacterium sp.]MDO4762116.1 P1 family peptidase [Corynebacterium sp.]
MSSGFFSDVPGIQVAHQSLGDTGCTVIVAPESATCAVEVRGGGPGTRETDLLEPHNTVSRVHAVCLSGGSAYGLAAADGVMRALEEHGIGFRVLENTPSPIVPIVPAAVIFDLLVGDPAHRPTAADGYAAAQAALANPASCDSGSVGAGCGASAGVLRGGFGQSSQQIGSWMMSVGIVANPVGSVVDPDTGCLWADAKHKVDVEKFEKLVPLGTKLNTTIGVIATNAPLTKAQAKRVAMVGHDGIAIAVRPAHSPLDGDTLFCMSTAPEATGVSVAQLGQLCHAASVLVARALVDAVVKAQPNTQHPGAPVAYSEIALT